MKKYVNFDKLSPTIQKRVRKIVKHLEEYYGLKCKVTAASRKIVNVIYWDVIMVDLMSPTGKHLYGMDFRVYQEHQNEKLVLESVCHRSVGPLRYEVRPLVDLVEYVDR